MGIEPMWKDLQSFASATRPRRQATEHDSGRTAERCQAGYTAPRHPVLVDTIGRAPNGKVDDKRLKAHAQAHLSES